MRHELSGLEGGSNLIVCLREKLRRRGISKLLVCKADHLGLDVDATRRGRPGRPGRRRHPRKGEPVLVLKRCLGYAIGDRTNPCAPDVQCVL